MDCFEDLSQVLRQCSEGAIRSSLTEIPRMVEKGLTANEHERPLAKQARMSLTCCDGLFCGLHTYPYCTRIFTQTDIRSPVVPAMLSSTALLSISQPVLHQDFLALVRHMTQSFVHCIHMKHLGFPPRQTRVLSTYSLHTVSVSSGFLFMLVVRRSVGNNNN